MPLVSVLTPCFNSARFIENCIQSVLSQDYPDIEFIVQDGGSTDGTIDILKKYSDRISWVSEKDKGQSDGLNRALQRCHGDYIVVLNSDDEFMPGAVRWAVENFERYPEMGAIYGDQQNIDENGKVLFLSEGPEYSYKDIFCCDSVIPAQAAFIRASALKKAGFFIDISRPTCPDYELWARLGLYANMKHVPGFVARYRIHPGSEGQQEKIVYKMADSKMEVMNKICDDPNVSAQIRSWRRPARAGILLWSAGHFSPPLARGKQRQAFRQRMKAFLIYPTHRTFVSAVLGSLSLVLSWIFGKSSELMYSLDLEERLRVANRIMRERTRAFDKAYFGAVIYRHIYLPIKNKYFKNATSR